MLPPLTMLKSRKEAYMQIPTIMPMVQPARPAFAVPLMRPAPRLKRAKITPSEPKNREPMLSMNKKEQIAMTIEAAARACEPVLRGGCTGGCCW